MERIQATTEIFLIASEKKSYEVKRSILLSCMGKQAVQIYNNFTFDTATCSVKYDEVLEKFDAFCNPTRGPMGHILDTTIRCLRAIKVQLPNKGKFAKLKPSLEKYLHYLMEHFLIMIMRVQYKGFYSS